MMTISINQTIKAYIISHFTFMLLRNAGCLPMTTDTRQKISISLTALATLGVNCPPITPKVLNKLIKYLPLKQ
ncbi:hypothetical protein ERO13_A05G083650v2 [Gossypium hirsutum]|uniref:Uncharacterized protein n=2 Tax=Gossypium TaxID=3633 RepID=A0A5J5VLN0_GOSBA|nr:hypothetical protein ES319_A05G087800v1 [Gossypium barbadense]KAG4198416.1 hypothetical protein ERO13_A05G083650v2 [Gossypium hirsutum]TYJ33234.1 hypothetical protein E1A91_A05G089100v1 [Gossypium mustelinum]